MNFEFILPLFLIILQQDTAEAIYCYECNANLEACADPIDYVQIQKYRVPCSGSCMIYYNLNDGNLLYRTCSSSIDAIADRGGQSGVFTGTNNNLYYLCNTDGCNGEASPVPQPPTFTKTTLSSYSIVSSSTKTPIIDCGLVPCNWQHGFVNSECICQCYENYYGEECEFQIDPCYDNAQCSSYSLTLKDCESSFTQNLCPKTCSVQCLGSTTASTSTTTTTTTSIDPCYDNAQCSSYSLTLKDCESSFTQNLCPKTCSVQCLGSTTASTSTTTTTTTSPCYDNSQCSSYNLTLQDCESSFTKNLCPKGCTSECLAFSICSELNCVYGTAQINVDGNCICNCNDKYYGPLCDKLNSTALLTSYDPSECNDLKCLDEDIVGLCPITCIQCGGTTFCKNGGTVDPQSCQCNCLPGFSGQFCESL